MSFILENHHKTHVTSVTAKPLDMMSSKKDGSPEQSVEVMQLFCTASDTITDQTIIDYNKNYVPIKPTDINQQNSDLLLIKF
ncbi:MAG: hypothetical protein HRU28_03610 [Rhizobiales bacterium]|nr:hypothetical protein [Hyphomicrobiales bacterium]